MASFGWQLLLSIVCAAILYVAASFLGGWAVATLFFCYCVLAVMTVVLDISSSRSLAAGTTNDGLLVRVRRELERAQEKPVLTRWRERCGNLLKAVYSSILWPAAFLKGFFFGRRFFAETRSTQLSLLYVNAHAKLDGFDLPCALFSLAIIAAIATAHFLHGASSAYAQYILIICIFATSLRHLEYVISLGGLLQRVRQGRGDPLLNFGIITAADVLALVVGYVTLKNWNTSAPLTWDAVRSTAEALMGSFTAAKEVWQDPSSIGKVLAPSVDLATSLSGLLLTTSLLKVIWEIGKFDRKDEDYQALAANLLMTGQFTEGLRSISRAKPSAPQLAIKAALLASVGSAAEAVGAMQAALADLKQDNLDTLATSWTPLLVGSNVPTSSVSALLCELLDKKAGDAATNLFLTMMIATKKVTPQDALAALPPHRAADYPLVCAHAHFFCEDYSQAIAVLKAAAPKRDIDKVIRQIALFDIGLATVDTEDELHQFGQTWLTDNAEEVKRLVGLLKSDIEKTILLQRMVRTIAIVRRLGGNTQAYFEALRTTVRAGLAVNPANEPLLNLEEQDLAEAAAAALRA